MRKRHSPAPNPVHTPNSVRSRSVPVFNVNFNGLPNGLEICWLTICTQKYPPQGPALAAALGPTRPRPLVLLGHHDQASQVPWNTRSPTFSTDLSPSCNPTHTDNTHFNQTERKQPDDGLMTRPLSAYYTTAVALVVLIASAIMVRLNCFVYTRLSVGLMHQPLLPPTGGGPARRRRAAGCRQGADAARDA